MGEGVVEGGMEGEEVEEEGERRIRSFKTEKMHPRSSQMGISPIPTPLPFLPAPVFPAPSPPPNPPERPLERPLERPSFSFSFSFPFVSRGLIDYMFVFVCGCWDCL